MNPITFLINWIKEWRKRVEEKRQRMAATYALFELSPSNVSDEDLKEMYHYYFTIVPAVPVAAEPSFINSVVYVDTLGGKRSGEILKEMRRRGV